MLDQQIKALYEDNKMDPKAIAETLAIEEDAVKLSLGSNSAKFRSEVRSGNQTFGEEVYNNAIGVMGQLLYAEQENVKLRAAKFIINENKGRHEVKSLLNNVKNININVNLISAQLVKARAALNAARNGNSNKPVDIESNNETPSKEGSSN